MAPLVVMAISVIVASPSPVAAVAVISSVVLMPVVSVGPVVAAVVRSAQFTTHASFVRTNSRYGSTS